MEIIKAEGLCKTFSSGGAQRHVLRNLDIAVNSGEYVVIMGSSGSGKSTLLYALSGMDKITLGSLYFKGERIDGYDNDRLAIFRRKNCGFVFQDIFLSDNMSVMDNVLCCGFLASKDRKAVIARAKELFTLVGIEESFYNKFPSQMSGGELQRAGIVRAMINNPAILFADEPTGALNSSSAIAVLDLLNQINEQGTSVVMVTHDIKTASRGERILYLKDGVILNSLELGKYAENNAEERILTVTDFLSQMGW